MHNLVNEINLLNTIEVVRFQFCNVTLCKLKMYMQDIQSQLVYTQVQSSNFAWLLSTVSERAIAFFIL